MNIRNLLCIVTMLACNVPMQMAAQGGGSVKGKVLMANDKSTVNDATVTITDMQGGVVGNSTVANGQFSVANINASEAIVYIQLIGCEVYKSEPLKFDKKKEHDLGTVLLKEWAIDMEGVSVTGTRRQVVYKSDRQQVNASSSVMADGGTAVDVLSNLPSVQTDADGNITFRGSGNFLVYIDGRLSPLTGTEALRQVPAAVIQDIELITTPGAIYKADGDVGIINITTKPTKDSQWSGMSTGSVSTIGTWNELAQVFYKHGKHTFSVTEQLTSNKSKSDFNQDKTTLIDRYFTNSVSDGTRYATQEVRTLQAGYRFNDAKCRDFRLDLQVGVNNNKRGGDMDYYEHRELDGEVLNDNLYDSHDRYILHKSLFQAATEYTRKTNERGDQWHIANRFRYDKHSLEYTESNLFDHASGTRYEGTRGYEEEHHWDCDATTWYDLHYRPDGQLKAGYFYSTYSEHGDYHFYNYDRETGEFIGAAFEYALPSAIGMDCIPFYYRRQTHALYAQLNDKFGAFSLDAGLRAERIIDDVDIDLPDASLHSKRWDLFPSAHLTYNSSEASAFILGYSRRVNRPGIWQTEPYITYEDYYTRKQGNIHIRPEFIQSTEATYRHTFGGNASFSLTAFYRWRKDVTDWVRTAYQPGVTLDIITNAGNQDERGAEATAVFHAKPWWQVTLNGSVYNYEFHAKSEYCTNAHGMSYLAGWINNFNVAQQTKLQFDGHLVGARHATQGREKAYCYFDLGLRRQLLKGSMSLSLVAHDIFHTARYYSTRQYGEALESITRVRPRYPNVLLSVTWNFNSSSKEHVSGELYRSAQFEGANF